jgi:hypothetical protein
MTVLKPISVFLGAGDRQDAEPYLQTAVKLVDVRFAPVAAPPAV